MRLPCNEFDATDCSGYVIMSRSVPNMDRGKFEKHDTKNQVRKITQKIKYLCKIAIAAKIQAN
jgi:enamine deaminase RidA (YjgF/YER057c/UK114 family)